MDTRVIEDLSVGSLELQGELGELLMVNVQTLSKMELLVNVLEHEIERVLLGFSVELISIEVVAVDHDIKLQHLSL